MIGLYVHVPFCRRKCPYCDFFSVPLPDSRLDSYPGLVIRHMEIARAKGWSGPVSTLFFGGGTPSLLSPEGIAEVIAAASSLFGLEEGAEISLEANPGTVTPSSLAGYRKAGVSRLSLGAQSLHPASLEELGRIHSPEQVRQAVLWGREAGFDDLSCDLIFARPGQTLEGVLEEVDAFLALCPDHFSCYGLTVEENTPFSDRYRAGELILPEEEGYAAQFLGVHERLAAAGFDHYEISNYARPGHRCRHNALYWDRRPYLGLGAGAHSFREEGWGERKAVPGDLDAFAAALSRGDDPAEVLETFDRRGAMAETLYLGLRTSAGVNDAAFRGRFGEGIAEAFPEAIASLPTRLRQEGGRWFFTPEDWLLYDTLILPFL